MGRQINSNNQTWNFYEKVVNFFSFFLCKIFFTVILVYDMEEGEEGDS